jgi:hypothetical protein
VKRGRLIVIAIGVVLLVTAYGLASWRRVQRPVREAPSTARAPEGVRVRVQVLNGTKIRGLARRATMLLRDRGFDVLEVGTISDTRDTTLVLDLSGHPDWANRVALALAPARVESRPDTSRYLDIAIILGSTWRPPAQPFYP